MVFRLCFCACITVEPSLAARCAAPPTPEKRSLDRRDLRLEFRNPRCRPVSRKVMQLLSRQRQSAILTIDDLRRARLPVISVLVRFSSEVPKFRTTFRRDHHDSFRLRTLILRPRYPTRPTRPTCLLRSAEAFALRNRDPPDVPRHARLKAFALRRRDPPDLPAPRARLKSV